MRSCPPLQSAPTGRKALYRPILSKLRQLMICRMAKPEEVIVVEDENGNIVRETMKVRAHAHAHAHVRRHARTSSRRVSGDLV